MKIGFATLLCAAQLCAGARAFAQSDSLENAPRIGSHVDDFELRRSPGGAALRSLALPGWGQLYTSHRRKALLAAGVELGLASWIAWETRIVDRELTKSRKRGETQAMVDDGNAPNYVRYVDHFELRRELLIYLGLSALGFALDAYVDAWLYGQDEEFRDFPVPRSTLRGEVDAALDPAARGVTLALRLRWP